MGKWPEFAFRKNYYSLVVSNFSFSYFSCRFIYLQTSKMKFNNFEI